MAKMESDKPRGEGHEAATLFEQPQDDKTGPSEPADDDLVLRDEAGDYYWIKREDYLRAKLPRDRPGLRQLTDQLEHMVRQGVVLADVPRGSLPGVDSACYLVNLAGIRRASPKLTAPRRPVVRPKKPVDR